MFASDNDITGDATLSAGTIRVGSDRALGSGVLTLSGGTIASAIASTRGLSHPVAFGGDVAIGDATGTGAMVFHGGVDLGGGTRSLTTVTDTTLTGTIGNGGLTKFNAGKLTITGASALPGPTTVSAGRLAVNGALDDSSVMILAAAEVGGWGRRPRRCSPAWPVVSWCGGERREPRSTSWTPTYREAAGTPRGIHTSSGGARSP